MNEKDNVKLRIRMRKIRLNTKLGCANDRWQGTAHRPWEK